MGKLGVRQVLALALGAATLSVAGGAAHASSTEIGAITVPDTNYPVPPGAIVVSPSGSDSNPGTLAAPFRTFVRALAVAPSGATIVLRAGTYREGVTSIGRRVTIQPYPHEQVWMKGSLVVTGWAPSGSRWSAPWSARHCQTCFVPAAIDPAYPTAGLPDLVFVDGEPLRQVSSVDQVTPDTFFVDYGASRLWLGSDPTGRTVEAAALDRALQFDTSGAAGSVVRGIGFAHYATTFDPTVRPAMVATTTSGVVFENNVFAWSAARGLGVFGPGTTVRANLFLYNGLLGLGGHNADSVVIEGNRIAWSNYERFSIAPTSTAAAAGVKLASSEHVVVRDNVFEDNFATGLWLDISSYDADVSRNLIRRNAKHGLSVEISGTAAVVSNVIVDNADMGLKLSGATDVRVWNNTLANNGVNQLAVLDDPRSNTNQAEITLGITWDTARVTLLNNILSVGSSGSSGPTFFSRDYSNPPRVGTPEMITSNDYDAFWRANPTGPSTLAGWMLRPGSTFSYPNYTTVAALPTATGREVNGWGADGGVNPFFANDAGGDYSPRVGGPALGTGQPLPADIATLAGAAPGIADRGALRWPGYDGAPAPLAADTFARSTANGWGAADVGGAWSTRCTPSVFSADGAGRITLSSPGTGCAARLAGVASTNTDLTATVSIDRPATGWSSLASLIGRSVTVSREYMVRVRVAPNGNMYLAATKRDGSSSEQLVSTETRIAGVSFQAGTGYRVRLQVTGTAPTTIRARLWPVGSPEPSTWQVDVTDASPALQAAGGVGFHAQVSSTATNVPVTFMLDDVIAKSL